MARVRSTTAALARTRTARPRRRRHVPPNWRFLFYLRRHARFTVPNQILNTISRPRRSRVNNTPSRVPLLALPDDILYRVTDFLDVASLISLGLTCKALAFLTTRSFSIAQTTTLNDFPTFTAERVLVAHNGPAAVIPTIQYTPTFSDRRILMLQLRPFMPRTHRLCWMCLVYTPIRAAADEDDHGWHATSRVNTTGGNALNIDHLLERPVLRVHAHRRCMAMFNLVNGRQLGDWCLGTAGASGGRDTFHPALARNHDETVDGPATLRLGGLAMWVHE
ncbi:hypothetical protein PV04_00704 [Phialophora macrospora]|uniref:F-box domain-containing protein n=1 Tax=Phialophora macrospora TaxID=1851006 RepID=A0A0D2GJJ7_9EURO|nr:hypothetical protein PV04_00704 [Phialophora macrospora]